MEINNVLEQVGLNEKQASIYTALLELGTASVQAIARKAELKRPTTYLILDELEQKGLVSLVPQKKALYTAESPEQLVSEINKKYELMKRFLPDLLAMYNAKVEKPHIQLFPGEEGVKQVYEQIFSAKMASFFGTIGGVSQLNPEVLKDFHDRLRQGMLHAQELFAPDEVNRKYALVSKDLPNYEIRFIKAGMELPTDCALYKDTVAFVFFKPQLMALTIKNQGVKTALQTLYEIAWQSADKVQ